MAIWSKIIGGVAGFSLGGPLGAIAGVFLGHAIDKMRDGLPDESPATDDERQASFSIAVVVIAAKLCKADGKVTKDEIHAFRQVFAIEPEDMTTVRELFNRAREDATGFEPYAAQIAAMFRHERVVLENLMGVLFRVALADGEYHAREQDFLARVADILGFSRTEFTHLEALWAGGTSVHATERTDDDDAYAVLGASRNDDDKTIRTKWRALVRDNHPDRVMAQGLPKDFIDLANEKLAKINAAYDRICAERGLK